MAIADMFHKGEIDVVSWSWGLKAPAAMVGDVMGRAAFSELVIVKRVDQATPTLMQYLRNHKIVPVVYLTVRKAGTTPLEYFKIEMERVIITSLTAESQNAELVERLNPTFHKIKVSYTPQGQTGARGGDDVTFEGDAHVGS